MGTRTQNYSNKSLIPHCPQDNRIKVVKYIDREDVEEPCKGDTPA